MANRRKSFLLNYLCHVDQFFFCVCVLLALNTIVKESSQIKFHLDQEKKKKGFLEKQLMPVKNQLKIFWFERISFVL